MPTIKDLPIEFHQQDFSNFCGAASSQMILRELGAGLLDQLGLFRDGQAHTVSKGWGCAPDGLTWILNNRQHGQAVPFTLQAPDSEAEVTDKIIASISGAGIPSAALVYGMLHWIVVRGFAIDDPPSQALNAKNLTYVVASLDVNNPWPPEPHAPPPPHFTGDNCGSGLPQHGVADENVSYSVWHSEYMTGVPTPTPTVPPTAPDLTLGFPWCGKFVVVCAQQAPTMKKRSGVAMPALPGLHIGPGFIGNDNARRFADQGLQQFGLSQRPLWQAALASGHSLDAALVKRLDAGAPYYLVPYGTDASNVRVTISVDALTGSYRQAGRAKGTGTALPIIDPLIGARRLAGQTILVDGRQFQLPMTGITMDADWQWKPCIESLSPYFPFQHIVVGGLEIFRRSDGVSFTALHDQGAGL